MLKKILGKILTLFCIPLGYILRNETIRRELWTCTVYRPEGGHCHWCNRPNDIEEEVYKLATRQSAEYVLSHFSHISGTIDRFHMLKYCVQRSRPVGLFLEFGVYNGDSINLIAKTIEGPVHGFDSFEGLPENWESCKAGQFSLGGKLPQVDGNVRLHAGWFDQTVPEFIKTHKEQVAFLHIDSDLYSSARTVLYLLRQQIATGTVIVFDEYFNYPNWQAHEYKAFQEFVHDFNIKYEYIAYCSRGYSVGLVIL